MLRHFPLHWLYPPADPLLYRLKGRLQQPTIAFTFDDGPCTPWTERVLDTLRQENVRATFFVLGCRAQAHPELIHRMVAEGHAVGNHTMTHPRLPLHSLKRARQEIGECTRVLMEQCGTNPTLFRAPHGFLRPGLKALLREMQLIHVPWTRGIWDTDRPAAEVLVQRATRTPQKMEILLLHDGTRLSDPQDQRESMVSALPRIIAAYRERGYRFVTADELIAEAA